MLLRDSRCFSGLDGLVARTLGVHGARCGNLRPLPELLAFCQRLGQIIINAPLGSASRALAFPALRLQARHARLECRDALVRGRAL